MTEEIEGILMKSLTPFSKKQISLDSPLFGPGGALESIQLVSYIVLVEQEVNSKWNKNLRFLSEKAFSQTKSPFRNLRAFGNYIADLLDEKIP